MFMTEFINDEYQTRITKLAGIRAGGLNPYPDKFEKSESLANSSTLYYNYLTLYGRRAIISQIINFYGFDKFFLMMDRI